LPTANVVALLLFGSRRATMFFGEFETQTSLSTAIQSGAPANS
jgi:hypothetical protein